VRAPPVSPAVSTASSARGEADAGPVAPHFATTDLREFTTLEDVETFHRTDLQYHDIATIADHADRLDGDPQSLAEPGLANEAGVDGAFDRVDARLLVRHDGVIEPYLSADYEVLEGSLSPEAYREAAPIPSSPTDQHGSFDLYPEDGRITTGLSDGALFHVDRHLSSTGEFEEHPGDLARRVVDCTAGDVSPPGWIGETIRACRPVHSVEAELGLTPTEPDPPDSLSVFGKSFDGDRGAYVYAEARPNGSQEDVTDYSRLEVVVEEFSDSTLTVEEGESHAVVRREVPTSEMEV